MDNRSEAAINKAAADDQIEGRHDGSDVSRESDENLHIEPGEKGDPYRRFRITKHACLVATWVLMVGRYFPLFWIKYKLRENISRN